MIRYFKKLEPNTKVILANNVSIQFSTIDGLTGYFATQEEYVQTEFARFIREGRYGIVEISEKAHIEEYPKKKVTAPPLKPAYREEIGSGLRVIGSDILNRPGAAAAAVAVETQPKTPPLQGGAALAIPIGTEKPAEFKPTVGRRIQKKSK